jgi:NADH-quinone oxidoreductase subunit M
MYKRVIFGAVKNKHVAELKDLMSYEFISFLLLAVFVILLGVYPNWLFSYIHRSMHDVLMLAYKTKI